ncbi:MAG: hypothetical protein IPK31_02620 [Chitinophagaceae bacterium]|nr:hypothetical protein [Chitinophagaceae bacterium]
MRKTSFLLVFCLVFYSCDQRNENIQEAKKNVMKYSELDSYMALTNHFDKEDNYYEIMPYALKMQKQGIGQYEFYDSYLKIMFDNKFDAKNILKLDKPEAEFLIYIVNKGAKAEDVRCREVLIQYYRNGWGVTKDIKKADSIYKSFGYPDTYIPAIRSLPNK